jgi:hypothetical protein
MVRLWAVTLLQAMHNMVEEETAIVLADDMDDPELEAFLLRRAAFDHCHCWSG